MVRRRNNWLLIGPTLLAATLFIEAGCKTGGPATPYDKQRPPVQGDLIVQAYDKGLAVSGATVQVLDPNGTTLTAATDSQGQAQFSFSYDLYQQEELPPFAVTFPTQGNYFLSRAFRVPERGQNIVTFWSDDNILDPVPQYGVTYNYNLQNTIIFDLQYKHPGNLQVPVSLAVQNMPVGWSSAFEKPLIGNENINTGVTITIPSYSFKQPALVFNGNKIDAGFYVSSIPTTIRRGYPINVWSSGSWVPTMVGVNVWNISGYWGFGSNNGVNVPWTGYVHIGIYGVDGQYYYSNTTSFTANSGTQTWNLSNYNCATHNCTGEVQFEMYAYNSDVGAYYTLYRTGTTLLAGGNITFPTQTF